MYSRTSSRSRSSAEYTCGLVWNVTQSRRYPRCLPYLNSIRAGTLRIGTTYCSTMFMGKPSISRLRNRPKMFITTATARMANRSSASRPRKVTLVRRFRYTGVTSSAIACFLLSADPGSSLDDEELREAKQSRHHQTKAGGKKMTHPAACGMNVGKHSNSQRSDCYLRCGIHGQDYIADPVDCSQQRQPIDVWVIPCPL